MADPVAIYAAALSTAGGAWQFYTWRADRRNRVELELVHARVRVAGDHEAQGVVLMARNHGSRAVRVIEAGVQITIGEESEIIRALPMRGTLLVSKLEPNDSASTWITHDEQESSDPYRIGTYVGWARIASGETVKSDRSVLVARPVDERGSFLPEKL